MRRSNEHDDGYAARYPGADSSTQWSYTAHPQGLPLFSSNVRSSASGAGSGYSHATGSGQHLWMPQGNSNTGGSYARQDQGVYAQPHQNPGYHQSGASQRTAEQWSDPSTAYGRHGIEMSNPGTSTSQSHWEHHGHNRTASYGVPTYDLGSTYASNHTASASSSLHPTSSTGEIHNYVSLPSTPQSTIESYLAPVKLEDNDPMHKSKRAYRCTWAGCTKAARGELFKSKDNARVHVHKHFGSDKLFECVVGSCRKTFASEDAAKRHRDTTESKAFSCGTCGKVFARKDYRDVHQRRCTV